MTNRIDPADWRPVGVDELERAADTVVRSKTHHLVVAGPGAGKTELLAQRACFLLQTGGCPPPRRILAISFKRDAARNLRERVLARCGTELGRRFDSFTFDAFSKGLLDRFHSALPEGFRLDHGYEPGFGGDEAELRDFLDTRTPPAAIGTRDDVRQLGAFRFGRDHVLGVRLPADGWAPTNAAEWATREYWKMRLEMRPVAKPTFAMIGRLAELLLRTNPLLIAALHTTYSHVFLDEFQDTTQVQYDLLVSAFLDSNAVLTAVGDHRQRIMGWAGALDDTFGRLEAEFGATRVQLLTNYRSAPELVRIQHTLMERLDPHSAAPVAAPRDQPWVGVCEVLVFRDAEEEAVFLARRLEHATLRDGHKPRDLCLLVKQKPKDYAAVLVPALAARAIKARDEGAHQDLLSEPLSTIAVAMLRLATKPRLGTAWDYTMRELRETHGIDEFDRVGCRKVERALVAYREQLRERLPGTTVQAAIQRLLVEIMDFVGERAFRLVHPQYRRGTFYERTLTDLAGSLAASRRGSADWTTALDDFEGLDSVPIMTIHKSKGLEYTAVTFVGLEDYVFRYFDQQRTEDICAFFVAFSRAKTRVTFTFARQRTGRLQAREKIGELYGLLTDAGVVPREIQDAGRDPLWQRGDPHDTC